MKFLFLSLFLCGFEGTSFGNPPDTDTNFFYVIHAKDRSFTNATIESVTAATATVFWEGGGQEVLLADMPMEIQRRYHYDPATARVFLDARAQKKAAARNANAGELAALSSAMNDLQEPQLIQVIRVTCSYEVVILDHGQKTNAYVVNLPRETMAFVNDYNDTFDFVNLHVGFNTSATYQFTDAWHTAGELTDAAKGVLKARAHLQELQSVGLEKSTILARPSMLVRNGYRFWKFEDRAPVSAASTQGAGNSILALRIGVPLEVYNEIADKAAADFPNDYEEQHYIVSKQLQAYKVLHPN
jgi:hypothetical protein